MQGRWREVQSVDGITGRGAFQAMGERRAGGALSAEEDDELAEILGVGVDTRDMMVGLLQRNIEDLRQRLASNSLGSFVVGRETAQRGERSPARAVLRTQASSVSKPASNWGG